jgi:GWxTD domain-containing protein
MSSRIILVIVLTIILTVTCSKPPANVVRPQTGMKSVMYNPSSTKVHPAYTVYHNSANSSILMVKVFPSELLFSDANAEQKMMAKLSIKYQLNEIKDKESTNLADSGSYRYTIYKENADKRFFTRIPLKAESGKLYELRISITDRTRNEESIGFLMVDKTSLFSQQNFLLTEVSQNMTFFEPFVVGNEPFKIDHQIDTFKVVYVSYYGEEAPLPRPSFSLAREKDFLSKPDSLWVLKYNKNTVYQLSYEGIYLFRFDTTINEGLTVLNFGDDYPRVKKAQQMVDPIAYLSSSVEYEKIKNSDNLKLAVDNFWSQLAKGKLDRARELIRIYYNRVYFANYYFTSFKPGWKTDRGMIYLIYGPPQAVTRSGATEKWIYYTNNFNTSLNFTFVYTSSPYTNNNYVLQRSESFETYWRQAIDTWRSGRIFIFE